MSAHRTEVCSVLAALTKEISANPLSPSSVPTWDIISGHVHLYDVAQFVKKCIREAGGVLFIFNTIGVCDGIVIGHDGMKYSFARQEIIADSVEIM